MYIFFVTLFKVVRYEDILFDGILPSFDWNRTLFVHKKDNKSWI